MTRPGIRRRAAALDHGRLSRSLAVAFAGLVVLATLSACGFQLRGAMDIELPPIMDRTLVRGTAPYSDLGNAVEIGLEQVGAGLAASPELATAFLDLDERFQRRVASIGNDGRVNEYELHYRLRFVLRDADEDPVISEQDIDLYRSYAFDPDQVLAKSNEEALLRDEMMRAAVAQMLRRLEKSAARESTSADAES